MPDEISVIAKTYDLTLWLLPHTAGFSRQHRFTLGSRIEEGILETLETLVEASYTRDKRDLLDRANRCIERLRYLLRLAKDLKLLTIKQYEFAVRALHAIGGEIGGWRKQQTQRGSAL